MTVAMLTRRPMPTGSVAEQVIASPAARVVFGQMMAMSSDVSPWPARIGLLSAVLLIVTSGVTTLTVESSSRSAPMHGPSVISATFV